jgi:hypothetical protein
MSRLPSDIMPQILLYWNMKHQLSGILTPISIMWLLNLLKPITILVTVVSRVNKEWKRMIDNHPLLLNDLDFSDPFLQRKLTTTKCL